MGRKPTESKTRARNQPYLWRQTWI